MSYQKRKKAKWYLRPAYIDKSPKQVKKLTFWRRIGVVIDRAKCSLGFHNERTVAQYSGRIFSYCLCCGKKGSRKAAKKLVDNN